MSESTRPGFRVIRGGGEAPGAPATTWLRALPQPAQLPSLQLSFDFASMPRSTVVSLSLHRLDGERFRAMLARGIREVIDVRLVTAFRGYGFDSSRVFEWFKGFGIRYAGIEKLAPPMLDARASDLERVRAYSEHLERHRELLDVVRARIDSGPCVLLSASPVHAGSEREVLLRVLEKKRKGIQVIVEDAPAR